MPIECPKNMCKLQHRLAKRKSLQKKPVFFFAIDEENREGPEIFLHTFLVDFEKNAAPRPADVPDPLGSVFPYSEKKGRDKE